MWYFLEIDWDKFYDFSNFHDQLKILNPTVYHMTILGLYRSLPKISAIL